MLLTCIKPALKRARYFLSSYHPSLLRSGSVVIHTFADGICNSKCSCWCSTQYGVIDKYPIDKIPFESFKKFLQLIADNKFHVIPYGIGEPRIHKEFVPFCSYALDEVWTILEIHSSLRAPSLSDDVFDVMTRFKR